MTPREAAAKLNISYESVLYHIKTTGLLEAEKSNGRWCVSPASVESFHVPPPAPGQSGGRYPGAGRPPSPGPAISPAEAGRRSIYLGAAITPEEISCIRAAITPPDLRGRILMRLAELAGSNKESYKRALADLGIEL